MTRSRLHNAPLLTAPQPRRRRDRRRESHPLFRREMRERWRRPLTLLQLGLFALIVSVLGYNVYSIVVPSGEWLSADLLSGLGHNFFFDVARWHALAWVPGGVLLAAPTLASERERGFLTDWVLAGLSPRGIVRAKFRALAGFVLVMACVPFPVFALCFALGGVSPLDFLATGALTLALALNCVAIGTLVSAGARTVTGALTAGLIAGGVLLFLATPMLDVLLSGPWFNSLLVALALACLPLLWISMAAGLFEFEVEKHVKGDLEHLSDADGLGEETRFCVVDHHGQLIPLARGQAVPQNVQLVRTSRGISQSKSAPATPVLLADSAGECDNNESIVADDKRSSASERATRAANEWQPSGNGKKADGDGGPNDGDKQPGVPGARGEDYSEVESLLLRWAQSNAITQRDVRRRFHGRHVSVGEWTQEHTSLPVWLVCWFFAGVVGWLLNALDAQLWLMGAALVLLPAMAYAALGAASGFTRERAQKMLSALQMTALSPLDIVWGKVAGVLLACAHWFGGPLLALSVGALHVGPWSALATLTLGVMCVVLTTTGSLTLSLWSSKTEIVALGALSAIAGLWWITPMLYIGSNFGPFFHAPAWLEMGWIAPMRALLEPRGDLNLASALLHLAALCAAGALVLGGLCVRQLRRTRAEEEATGLMQRDLSRGWH